MYSTPPVLIEQCFEWLIKTGRRKKFSKKLTTEKNVDKIKNLRRTNHGVSSLKIRIQRTDKCEHRQFRGFRKALKKLTKFAL